MANYIVLQLLSMLMLMMIVSSTAKAHDHDGDNDLLSSSTILYLPLDERFTTRDAFLNLGRSSLLLSCNHVTVCFLRWWIQLPERALFVLLAKVTPFHIVTPPPEMLSLLKVPANLTAINLWMMK